MKMNFPHDEREDKKAAVRSGFRQLTNLQGLLTTQRGCKINLENQFIDFRLITQSRKNHVLSCFVSNLKPLSEAASFV
ncbi:MAG: hypothetical protein RR510_08265 [Morganella sp. (in: enterobacteria)]